MKQAEKIRIQQEFKDRMDYDELLNCMRCGFCLPSCPTYIESGYDETHSPRGRIALMKAVVDGDIEPDEEVKRSLDMCLGCRACEPVCPSGVNYGHLLEQARDIIYQNKKLPFHIKAVRTLMFKEVFPYQNRMIGLTGLLGFYQRSGAQSLARKTNVMKLFPEHLQLMERILPEAPARKNMKNRPAHLEPAAPKRKKVAFFSGCLMDTMFLPTNDATTKLLQLAGCEIVIPKSQTCCGALHAHSGEKQDAKELAKKNIEAFEEDEIDYIITNAGGCGALLTEYNHLLDDEPQWNDRALRFSEKIKDLSSILVELAFHKQDLKLEDQVVTYQDSCHLKNVQKTFMQPRMLLESIEGAVYTEMKDAGRCCGSAGIYNIVEPEMSMKILDYKMEQARAAKATTIVTANPGCLLQMKLGIEKEGLAGKVRAVHIADLLLEAWEGGKK
ncbi:(Fe-S)-binding protein [Bacillus salacetis]|uniref:Glycolate oxidase iron-sulfur subunit n=1 Tax=Bacillus salacetis TaxID=2315464 RepID=A0A3A1QZ99_9BACI|nr:(Fe-S)-binding protein [Bacillus salacetis]RIW34239.1 (Fe-S)-binding protein [Bacillus salacetis]